MVVEKSWKCFCKVSGTHSTGKTGKMAKKTQGIWFAQVVNSVILKVKEVRSLISLPSQFCVCNSHKSRKLAQGKFAVGQGNTGNLKMQFEWVP